MVHMCRPMSDFLDAKTLKFSLPTSPTTGQLEVNILMTRWKSNMHAYRYNYIVIAVGTVCMAALYFWRLLFAFFFSAVIFLFSHLSTIVKPEPIVIGQHVVSSRDKLIASSLISAIFFFVFGALTPTILLMALCFVVASIHAMLRSKPPALSAKRQEEAAEVKATNEATAVEEGSLMEEDLNNEGSNNNMRARGGGVGVGGGGGGVGHFVGGGGGGGGQGFKKME